MKLSTKNRFSDILRLMKRAAARQFTAILLTFWLSGIVLLFCCANMERVSAAETPESCPLSKAGHCNKSGDAAKPADLAAFQKQTLSFDCCGFIPRLFSKAQIFEKSSPLLTASETEKPAAPKFFYAAESFQSPAVYQTVIRNRSGTYLKNCVFRI